MNTQDQMEERLWDYIDGLSSTAEQSAIEALIAANIEWQHKYKELLGIHQLMHGTGLEEPSLRFTKNVMEEITRLQVSPAAKIYINKNIIRSIAAFFITMITGFLVYSLGQFKWTSSGPASGSGNFMPRYDLNADLEKFNYGKIFNNPYTNIFILVTVILGLVLLDMYLQRKRQQHTHKEL